MNKIVSCMIGIFLAAGMVPALTFHIDPVNGTDAGTGSASAPWQTLAQSWRALGVTGAAKTAGNITVELTGGHYGRFSLTGTEGRAKASSRPWITYKAAPGSRPVFSGMSFLFSEQTELNLRFEGITVQQDGITGRGKAAAAAGSPVYLDGAANVEYRNSSFLGSTWQSDIACVRLINCRNLLFDRCEVGNGGSGFTINSCQDFTIRYNHIHTLSNSGIKYMVGNKNAVLEYNHIHDQQTWNGSHASAISIRSGDVTIRGNIMHDGWTSSGMMLYDDDMGQTYVYNNVTIEDNVLYDIANGYYVLRIFKLGTNVIIRNNTIFEPLKTSLVVHSLAAGHNGSGLRIYNNVIVGATKNIPATATVRNNIFSRYNGSLTAAPATNVIYGSPVYFINGFFAQTPLITKNHGQTLDFSPAPGSPAVGFGDPALQSASGTGSLGPDGFIRNDGVTRTGTFHSAGAYELQQVSLMTETCPNLREPVREKGDLYSIRGARIRQGGTLPSGIYLAADQSGMQARIILVH